MERTAKSLLLSSAYPLKAVKHAAVDENQPKSPYLQAILSGITKQTPPPGGRVFSLIRRDTPRVAPRFRQSDKLPLDIELTEKEWFNNYE